MRVHASEYDVAWNNSKEVRTQETLPTKQAGKEPRMC
jgi:hypothetical protein